MLASPGCSRLPHAPPLIRPLAPLLWRRHCCLRRTHGGGWACLPRGSCTGTRPRVQVGCAHGGQAASQQPQAAEAGDPPPESGGVGSPLWAAWDRSSTALTLASTASNLLFLLPQIVKNAALLQGGQAAQLAGLSWVAFSTGFLGNMLLLAYFTHQQELSACLVQAVGAGSTLVLLGQVWLAGLMPPWALAALASFFLLGALVTPLRLAGLLPSPIWGAWQDLLGLLGLAVLPQVLWASFCPLPSWLPGILAALAGAACLVSIKTGSAPEALADTWQKLSGWTATLLFMFMPVAQLQTCLSNPASLAGLSPVSSVLGLLGNGLMIPRALFTRDLIWFTGATWGATMMGWGMLLIMALYSRIPRPLFALITLSFVSYLATVFTLNAKALGLSSPLESLSHLRP